MSVKKQKLVQAFSDSVGKVKAREIINKAAENTGVRSKSVMEDEDAIAILENISEMDEATSYMHIAANTLVTKIRTNKWD